MLDSGRIVAMGTYTDMINATTDAGRLAFHEFLGQNNFQNQKEGIESAEINNGNNNNKENVMINKSKKSLPVANNDKNDESVNEVASERLIVDEKIEEGRVSFRVILNYFESCTLLFSVIALFFFILMDVAQTGTALYLRDWTEKSKKEQEKNADSKFVRIGVYTALGISMCNNLILCLS
jgi:hypothetical protein